MLVVLVSAFGMILIGCGIVDQFVDTVQEGLEVIDSVSQNAKQEINETKNSLETLVNPTFDFIEFMNLLNTNVMAADQIISKFETQTVKVEIISITKDFILAVDTKTEDYWNEHGGKYSDENKKLIYNATKYVDVGSSTTEIASTPPEAFDAAMPPLLCILPAADVDLSKISEGSVITIEGIIMTYTCLYQLFPTDDYSPEEGKNWICYGTPEGYSYIENKVYKKSPYPIFYFTFGLTKIK